jgi:RES domain-containing protein
LIELYRIHGAAYDVFDTTGTFLFDGRWHTRGTRLVYTAEHASLAALEVLIHAESKRFPPKILTRIHLPEDLPIETTSALDFAASQRFGNRWIEENQTPVLRVPSVTVNELEFNYLLNPAHRLFRAIKHDKPIAFPFDQRFFHAR